MADKGTICQKLRENRNDLSYSVSATTRAPRKGEVDGKDYFFLTIDRFKEMIANDEMLEYAEIYGNYYGTPRSYVMNILDQGRDVVLEIDPQGALQIKKRFPDAVFVFIVPPSLDELTKRIYKRGTDSEEVIKRRLSAATSELAYASKYDYIIVNDEVEKASKKVSNIIDAERNRAVRTFFIVNEICRNGTCEE